MKDKDAATKEFTSRPDVFADAFNVGLFKGKLHIAPETLKEVDTTAITALRQKRGRGAKNTEFAQKYRDVLKMASIMENDDATLILLGIENQSQIDYCMPLRIFLYEAMQYEKQRQIITQRHKQMKDLRGAEFTSGFSKVDRLKPVITLVINWDTKPWDGARSVHELLDCKNADILSFVCDYRIHLLEPVTMSEDELKQFQSELMPVFSMLRFREDKAKRAEIIAENAERFHVSPLAVDVVNATTGVGIEYSEEEEMVDMSGKVKTLREIMRDEVKEEVREEMRDKLEEEFREEMRDKVKEEVREEMRDKLEEEFREEVREEQLETSICAVASMLSPQQIATAFKMTVEAVQGVLAKHGVSPIE